MWLWSCGKEFDFKKWGKGEPNNHGGGEGCMEINFRGTNDSALTLIEFKLTNETFIAPRAVCFTQRA